MRNLINKINVEIYYFVDFYLKKLLNLDILIMF